MLLRGAVDEPGERTPSSERDDRVADRGEARLRGAVARERSPREKLDDDERPFPIEDDRDVRPVDGGRRTDADERLERAPLPANVLPGEPPRRVAVDLLGETARVRLPVDLAERLLTLPADRVDLRIDDPRRAFDVELRRAPTDRDRDTLRLDPPASATGVAANTSAAMHAPIKAPLRRDVFMIRPFR